MKRISLFFYVFVAFCYQSRAQDHYDPARALSSEELFLKQSENMRAFTKPGQRYLILDASPLLGGYHRYRYFPGDAIRFRLKGETTRFNEEIYSVSDSSFTFALVNEAAGRMEYREIPLSMLKKIKTFHRIPWVTEGAFMLPIAGLVYIGADFFNKGIDGQRFTTDKQSLLVGGSIMATGLLCYKLSFSAIKIGRNNRLKVLKTY